MEHHLDILKVGGLSCWICPCLLERGQVPDMLEAKSNRFLIKDAGRVYESCLEENWLNHLRDVVVQLLP